MLPGSALPGLLEPACRQQMLTCRLPLPGMQHAYPKSLLDGITEQVRPPLTFSRLLGHGMRMHCLQVWALCMPQSPACSLLSFWSRLPAACCHFGVACSCIQAPCSSAPLNAPLLSLPAWRLCPSGCAGHAEGRGCSCGARAERAGRALQPGPRLERGGGGGRPPTRAPQPSCRLLLVARFLTVILA